MAVKLPDYPCYIPLQANHAPYIFAMDDDGVIPIFTSQRSFAHFFAPLVPESRPQARAMATTNAALAEFLREAVGATHVVLDPTDAAEGCLTYPLNLYVALVAESRPTHRL